MRLIVVGGPNCAAHSKRPTRRVLNCLFGLPGWSRGLPERGLPEEDAAGFVDGAAGEPVLWVHGQGWMTGSDLGSRIVQAEYAAIALMG
jgi:hypothetical protein